MSFSVWNHKNLRLTIPANLPNWNSLVCLHQTTKDSDNILFSGQSWIILIHFHKCKHIRKFDCMFIICQIRMQVAFHFKPSLSQAFLFFVVVTFNPALPNINHIITGNRNILHSSKRCKEAIPSPPLISRFRSCMTTGNPGPLFGSRDMFHNMSKYREHVGPSFSLEIC